MRKKDVTAIVLAACAIFISVAAGARADEATAKKAFDANKCSNCHSIEKLGMARKIQSEKTAGPDLSKVGASHDAAWIVKWCMREVEKDGKTHKSEYKGTKEDLQAIADWLATFK
jgi:mono/diheme cytochrome c family protein